MDLVTLGKSLYLLHSLENRTQGCAIAEPPGYHNEHPPVLFTVSSLENSTLHGDLGHFPPIKSAENSSS